MSELTNIHARAVKDLTTPTELPVDPNALDQVKLVAGNFPAEYAGNEAMTVGMIKNLAAEGREEEIEEVIQRLNNEETRAIEADSLLTQNKADKTYVDVQDSSLQSQINQKATAAYLDSVLTEQTQTVNIALSNLSATANKYYSTLAAANADIANIALNQSVTIGEAANSGLWEKKTAEATSLTKSPYDPLTQAKTWATDEFANDILRPLHLKNYGVAGQRFNKAIKSLSLRGDHNGKLITVAIAAYVNGVFTIVLSRPDSLSEQMSSSNSKIVARFTGTITFAGVQTLVLESYSNVAAKISGEIVIDFDQLLQTDSISGSYIASDRLFDSRAIIDLNGQFSEVSEIKTNIANLDTKTDDVKAYVDVSAGVVFTKKYPPTNSLELRLNKAIKSLSLRGDHNGKMITLASFTYANGIFTVILASPASVDEVMSAASNTKYIARYSATNNFTGVQTLKLEPYGNPAAEISGEIVVDFGQLQQSDMLLANYVANERVISNRNIIDLNGQYSEIKDAKNAAALVSGSDPKNNFINSAIEEIVFFKPIPTDKYFILSGLFYTGTNSNTAAIHIYASDDKKSVGTVWAQGVGEIGADNRALVIFDQGYAIVRMGLYYPTNVGAAVLGDNATFETRGINSHFIKRGVLDSGIYQRYPKQFVDVSTFHIPTDYLQRSVKLYVKGEIAVTDYYVLSVLNWSLTNSKYRLTYQIRKMSAPDQDIASGLIVYGGFIEFDSIEAIKGNVTVVPPKLNKHPFDAELEIDFTFLKYRTDNNNIYSPYVFNKAGTTYNNFGFDIQKLRKASSEHFKSVGGGLTQYASLKDALAVKEKGLFAIGGNTFKARNTNPLSKEDFICTNNPPKVLSKKPSKKEFDFYYKGSKIRLEQIDSSDNFYFLNAGFIVKAPHPIKQTWSQVASVSASDFVVYDHQTATHYSIANFTQLFTATQLTVPTISWLRLTYDDELMIIATDTVRVIMFTENGQTSLRTFNFNGSIGTKYAFGAGVNIVKDWCMTHHKNVMFFSDYDSGITTEGTNVRGTTGGNKCYVSLDNGYTFTQCFDFNGNGWTNVTNPSNIISHNSAQAHIHAVTYDPKQDIAWIVTGDGATSNDNSSFFWSRDKGQTWTHTRTTLADGGRCQMIMALPFDSCVAFGSDASNLNGVGVITYNGEQMIHEVAKNFITSTGLYAFARSTWHSQKHGVKYMSFGQDVQRRLEPDAKSFVVASSNGYVWEEVWSDYSDDIYGNVYCYDDSDGKLYVSLDGTNNYKERVVLCDVSYV